MALHGIVEIEVQFQGGATEQDAPRLKPPDDVKLHGAAMPTKIIDGYEVEFTGERLEGTGQWGAYVSIFAPSANPMHLAHIVPKRRVSADLQLLDQHAAEIEAERAALTILNDLRS